MLSNEAMRNITDKCVAAVQTELAEKCASRCCDNESEVTTIALHAVEACLTTFFAELPKALNNDKS